MKRVYQQTPISLTSGQSGNKFFDAKDSKVKAAYSEVSKYFQGVRIGEKTRYDGSAWVKSMVPLIELFRNGEYREKYLSYNANSTNESVIRLKNILSDPETRKKYCLLMIEAIGDTYTSYGIDTFESLAIVYTFDNYLKGGKRVTYYLNTAGVKSDDLNKVDLTDAYLAIKSYRAKQELAIKEAGVTQKRA